MSHASMPVTHHPQDPPHSPDAPTRHRPDRPDIPDHPAYQQILTALADEGRPMRARDLSQALDLPILPKNTEGIRFKLKRLVSCPHRIRTRLVRPPDA
ncbi:hypothetical protein [Streptomyces sp. CoH27]|uniref:hypothetical protein n=1 Tax=Streptomyces sp. CoH27 TaxID=2875763 RepID=UPI001CD6F212|nr:hypothetical protein [Streptomyces sp. CoH27]